MDRLTLRVAKRAAYLILILTLARIAVPLGGYHLTWWDTTPLWYENLIALAAGLGIVGLVTALVGNGAVAAWIPRTAALLAGATFFAVATYVALNPGLSVFVSKWGLILSDLGLGVMGLVLWRVLSKAHPQDLRARWRRRRQAAAWGRLDAEDADAEAIRKAARAAAGVSE